MSSRDLADTVFGMVPEPLGVAAGVWVRTRRRTHLFAATPFLGMHAFPSVDNAPSNAICRRLGFELLEACEFEYPKEHFMTCNDWRLDLRA